MISSNKIFIEILGVIECYTTLRSNPTNIAKLVFFSGMLSWIENEHK